MSSRVGISIALLVFLSVTSASCSAQTASATEPQQPKDAKGKFWVYIGTYTKGPGQGIFVAQFDSQTGILSAPKPAGEADNPSFLTIAPNRKTLYAISEVSKVGDKEGGGVAAYSIKESDGTLQFLNLESTVGAGPCHVTIDKEARNLLVANYGGGSVTVLPIGADAKIRPASCFVQHGTGKDSAGKPRAPHAHSVTLDAANNFAIVADLGLDQVLIYRFDSAIGKITPNDPPFVALAAGAGPRHFAFHPDCKRAFVINEKNSTVTAFKYEAATGKLEVVQTISTLPPFFVSTNYPADILVHPNGKWIYGSNRGHNSIAGFKFDDANQLVANGHQRHEIKNPRNFNLDPTGKFLLVANQDADTIVVFRVNGEKGTLDPTDSMITVPKPACLKFVVR